MYYRRLHEFNKTKLIISFFNNSNGFTVLSVRDNNTDELLFTTRLYDYVYLENRLQRYNYKENDLDLKMQYSV